jgi:hypothetical protein
LRHVQEENGLAPQNDSQDRMLERLSNLPEKISTCCQIPVRRWIAEEVFAFAQFQLARELAKDAMSRQLQRLPHPIWR